MTTVAWILLACAIAYATKLVGYVLPRRWLEAPLVRRTSGAVTVALLAALTAVNAFTSGQRLVLDARLPALVVAAIALRLKAPFLVVVLAGALTAAGARMAGMP